jgi:hypothetical protein
MNLTDINLRPTAKKLNRFVESRFGFQIDFDRMTVPRAQQLYQRLEENLNEIKRQHGIYHTETNPRYTELFSIKESIGLWLDQNSRYLTEGETSSAEVIVAAKGMVDNIQDMAEKISKMQNEDLVAVIDSARDQIGIDQADVFKEAAAASLGTLLTTLQQQREALDLAVRALAGEQVGGPMAPQPMAMASDMDQIPAAEPAAAPVPAEGGIGRERR